MPVRILPQTSTPRAGMRSRASAPPAFRLLRHKAYQTLREKIINFELKPGTPLVELELAERLGMSRTPIREALNQLQEEGFVILTPHKGALVAEIDARDIEEIFEIRRAVEGMAARQAAAKITSEQIRALDDLLALMDKAVREDSTELAFQADTRFHSLVLLASGNGRAAAIVDKLFGQIHRVRFLSATIPGRIAASIGEHKGIAEALKAHDGRRAQQLMERHIKAAYENVTRVLMRSRYLF